MTGNLLKIILFIIIFTVYIKAFGPDVSVYRNESLKWENGAYGYHVMFKSLLESEAPDLNNPQADTCIDGSTGSTYTLDLNHIPVDAQVKKAFLIWTGAVSAALQDQPTDNEVSLSFVSKDGNIKEELSVKGKKAYKITEPEGFEFDASIDEPMGPYPPNSYFTYRVDITDFFISIHSRGEELGVNYEGYTLYGDYNVKDLLCAEDSSYVDTTTMVSGWAIIIIYTSGEIRPRNIYIYDSFKSYLHQTNTLEITGFEFPKDPEIKITLAAHEGDVGIVSPKYGIYIPEGIHVRGENPEWISLSNECNPEAWFSDGYDTLDYVEIFNSISSVYGWADKKPTCIGGIPPYYEPDKIEYAMDVDTFLIDSTENEQLSQHFKEDGEQIELKISTNQDMVITNFMIVSLDTKYSSFIIPDQPEMVACTPVKESSSPSYHNNLWCDNGLDHTFAIRIENRGQHEVFPVKIQNYFPRDMKYVQGSTEYAYEFEIINDKKIAKKWIKIEDNDGQFPLSKGFNIMHRLKSCNADSDYLECDNTLIVRYRATVESHIPYNNVFENIATISSALNPEYRTNFGIPIKLVNHHSHPCVSNPEEIDLSDCGGRIEVDDIDHDEDDNDDDYKDDSDNDSDDDSDNRNISGREVNISGCGCSIL